MELLVGALLIAWFVAFAALEAWHPLRRWRQPRSRRLLANAMVATTAIATVRLIVVPAAGWAAARAADTELGLVAWLGFPGPLSWLFAFVLFDWTIWGWHWANHRVPGLWRFHSVHHTDLDLDVSTALRFHVGELVLSAAVRIAQVTVIGIAPLQLLIFETITNAATMFHHSNVRLPLALERRLVRVVVTPRMHGIHHSSVERETNANLSVVFSWWDRLHGSLRLDIPQSAVVIGLPAWQRPDELTGFRLLTMPFRRQRPAWLTGGPHADRRPIGLTSDLVA